MFKEEYQKKYDAVAPDPVFRQKLEGRIEEMRNGRRSWMPRTAIIVLAAMVMLTAVGFATGAFRSVFGSMTNVFGDGAATDYEYMDAAANTNVFSQSVTFESGITAQIRLEQSYYNGQQLATGWSVEAGAEAELLEKSDARTADVEESVLAVDLEDKLGAEKAAEFYRRLESEGWAGAAWYDCYLSDQTYLADVPKVVGDDGQEHAPDGAILLPGTDCDWQADGVYLSFDEFETPLPEAAQDRNSLKLGRKAVCQQYWLVADGDKVYTGMAPAEKVELTFEIGRNEDYKAKSYSTEAKFPNHTAEIQLTCTPIRAEFSIENRISDEWKAIWDGYDGYLHAPLNLEQDVVFDYEILADGELVHSQNDSYRGAEGMSGWFMLPTGTKQVVFRPVYANSGANAGEDIVIDLAAE